MVKVMESFVKQSLLYDFYGDLLNDHQKSIYEAYVMENLSLAEIAEQEGIKRQGVHDIIKRADALLNSYEERLHLVERFLSIKEKVSQIEAGDDIKQAKKIAGEILEML